MPEHTIEALCVRSHEISFSKGWVSADGDPRSYACITNLNHSELSEAMEEWRNNKKVDEVWYEVKVDNSAYTLNPNELVQLRAKCAETDTPVDAKPCGIPIELADFVIRVTQHVGTAKKGKHLAEELLWADREVNKVITDFDELLADLHKGVSRAYDLKTAYPDGERYLQPLAIALSKLFTSCKELGIDVWAAIDEKEAYNRTRPIKHGGKKV
jgi:hypothetical protein